MDEDVCSGCGERGRRVLAFVPKRGEPFLFCHTCTKALLAMFPHSGPVHRWARFANQYFWDLETMQKNPIT